MAATDAGKTNKPYTLAQVNPQISISCVSSEKGMGREREIQDYVRLSMYTLYVVNLSFTHMYTEDTHNTHMYTIFRFQPSSAWTKHDKTWLRVVAV